jgi:hypothetical protein
MTKNKQKNNNRFPEKKNPSEQDNNCSPHQKHEKKGLQEPLQASNNHPQNNNQKHEKKGKNSPGYKAA